MPDQDNENIDTLRSMLKASGASAVLKAASEPDGDEGEGNAGKGKGGKEEPDGDEKYNADYMKKHMKKYLKEKPEEMKAHMKSYLKDSDEDERKSFMKEMGLHKAAVLDAAETTAGLDDAEVTVVDGTAMFKAFSGFVEEVSTVLEEMNERIHGLTAMQMESNLLQKASGHVLIKAAEAVDTIGSQPNQVRGTGASAQGSLLGADGGASEPLQKAAALGSTKMKELLLKAAKNGNEQAGRVLGQVEVSGGQLARLPQNSIRFINELADKATVA